MSDKSEAKRLCGELAFEHGFLDSPPELWRLDGWRYWSNRRVRTSEWFANEKDARERAVWLAENGKVISLTKYIQEPGNER